MAAPRDEPRDAYIQGMRSVEPYDVGILRGLAYIQGILPGEAYIHGTRRWDACIHGIAATLQDGIESARAQMAAGRGLG